MARAAWRMILNHHVHMSYLKKILNLMRGVQTIALMLTLCLQLSLILWLRMPRQKKMGKRKLSLLNKLLVLNPTSLTRVWIAIQLTMILCLN